MIRLLLPANVRGAVKPTGWIGALHADTERMFVDAGSAEYVQSAESGELKAESPEGTAEADTEAGKSVESGEQKAESSEVAAEADTEAGKPAESGELKAESPEAAKPIGRSPRPKATE